ncbi:MAG: hypothetical protein SXU28_10610 [Pseudomonadota bacterium]|nr:hypothetical protein [Pseudomonadota bacterium]
MENFNAKTLALLAAVSTVVSACSGGNGDTVAPAAEEQSAQEPASEPVVMAETAWLTVSNDGAVLTTFLDPDGQYRDFRNGEPAFNGTWSENADDQLCFTPDTGIGGCWTTGSSNDDGSMRVTNEDGRAIMLKRITYQSPASSSESDTGQTDEETAEG